MHNLQNRGEVRVLDRLLRRRRRLLGRGLNVHSSPVKGGDAFFYSPNAGGKLTCAHHGVVVLSNK
jgi:hypothetical protein